VSRPTDLCNPIVPILLFSISRGYLHDYFQSLAYGRLVVVDRATSRLLFVSVSTDVAKDTPTFCWIAKHRSYGLQERRPLLELVNQRPYNRLNDSLIGSTRMVHGRHRSSVLLGEDGRRTMIISHFIRCLRTIAPRSQRQPLRFDRSPCNHYLSLIGGVFSPRVDVIDRRRWTEERSCSGQKLESYTQMLIIDLSKSELV
jgi:hypothetical protein